MKRVVASAGAFAVGVAGLRGANVIGLTPQEASKWWTLSGSVRGFYDDNMFNASSNALSSIGWEISPGVSVNLPLERTLISSTYRYTASYYEERPNNKVDQQHEFDARVNHRITERYSVNFENSFVSSAEPDVVDQGAAGPASFARSTFSAIRNRATIDFTGRLTPITGFGVGYQNSYYNYSEDGDGSLSALLDRIDQLVHLDALWFPVEHT